ncbi:MAG: apolipoprotein N-acyltransferase [Planctomycetota bacterium]
MNDHHNVSSAPAGPDASPQGLSRRRVWLLCAATAVGWSVCFAPLDGTALAYVILAPWAVAMAAGRGRTPLWAGWLTGLVGAMIGLYWLTWVTVIGYLGVAVAVSGFWLVGAWVVRRSAAAKWPLFLVLPVVWVALEYGRAWLLGGFPWFFLGHSQYRWVRLIQVADLTGVYGVSFAVALANGLIADAALALYRGSADRRRLIAGGVTAGILMAGLLGYGTFRLRQAERTTTAGPTVAVVQSAVPIDLYTGRAVRPEPLVDGLIADSAPLADAQVDLVVWPETVLPTSFDRDWASETPWLAFDPMDFAEDDRAYLRSMQRMHRKVGALLETLDAPLLAGGTTVRRDDEAAGGVRLFNSAMLMAAAPDGGVDVIGTYHKIHCVPFSEYVPFERGAPWLHRALRWFVPDVMHQLTPGRHYRRFRFAAEGRSWRMAVPICYEGTFARVCRRLAHGRTGKQIDVLVNLSNDGWFIYPFGESRWASTELDQHLSAYVFRAIESRVPVVRAVNTGISGFIDSSGRIGPVVTDPDSGTRKMVTGTAVQQLLVDGRRSRYSRVGDLVAQLCSIAAAGLGSVLWWRGHRAKRMRKKRA